MTTDRDIVRALTGEPGPERQRSDNAIREAFGHAPAPVEGAKPTTKRGDEFEGVSIWAAKEAATRATTELAEAIMRADGSKNIYMAEHEAKDIAAEAYENAARSTPYEDDRHRFVEKMTRKLAESVKAKASRPTAKPSPRRTPLTAAEARPTTIEARRVRITKL